MKIIRTIESFYPFVSGPANQAFKISNFLEKSGIESPVYTTFYKAENSPKEEIIKNVRVKRFKTTWSIMKYFFTKDLKKQLENDDFDIIHSHNYRCYQTDIALRIAKKKNKPFILSAHGSITGYSTSLKGLQKLPYVIYDIFTGKAALRNADAIIVNSKQELKRAIDFGITKEKLHLIPFGIDVEKYKTEREIKDKNLTLLFVGNISRNRNLEPIIKSMPSIDKRFNLRIVGKEMKSSSALKSGYIDELKKLCVKLSVQDKIEFVGPKYDEDLIREYKSADVFVYTSLSENFGQTIMEAAASGLPLVVTPVGIVNDIIIDRENGFIVDFHDEKMIAGAVNNLIDPKKRTNTGNKVRRIIEEKYDWEKIKTMYLEIYKKKS